MDNTYSERRHAASVSIDYLIVSLVSNTHYTLKALKWSAFSCTGKTRNKGEAVEVPVPPRKTSHVKLIGGARV